MAEKYNSKKKNSIYTWVNFLVLLLGAVLFLALAATVEAPDQRFDSEVPARLNQVWTVEYQGKIMESRLPVELKGKADETARFSTVLDDLEGFGENIYNSIMFRAAHQYVKVYVDGQLIGESGYRQHTLLGDAPYNSWVLLRLPQQWQGKTLTIEQTGYYDGCTGILNGVFIGSKNALVFQVVHRALPRIVFNTAIMLVSLMLLGGGLLFQKRRIAYQLRYLSLFAMVTSLWLTLESGGYQLMFGKAPLVANGIFILFSLIPVLTARFLMTYESFFNDKFMSGAFWFSTAGFGAVHLLQFAGIADYLNTIVVIHVCLIAIIAAIIRKYIWCRFVKRQQLLDKHLFVSCLLFAGFGCIDMLRFYLSNPSEQHVIYSQIGLLAFTLILAYFAIKKVFADSEASIREELFKKMAFTDLLTGLPNRNAYEQRMDFYRRNPDIHPIILVGDLNCLKEINDNRGHAMGDEAIICAGRELENQFDGYGRVYRIGGDEFCVMSENLSEELIREKAEKLKSALKGPALGLPFPVSLAVGWHRECGEGIDAAFSAADMAMYREKERQKDECRK